MNLLDQIKAKVTPEVMAGRDAAAIATAFSADRKKIVSRLIGEGTISNALGLPAGPIFIYFLKAASEQPLPAQPTAQDYAQKAMLEQAWRLISAGNFDVGLPSVRAGLDLFVGQLPGFDQTAADLLKNLAEVDDPVTEYDVRCALWDADGNWLGD